ncbi:MAG: cell division protein SepF [Actinobacteria bacterium HGW-Actinobacteria-10]|nr:MAG: cell division protein SepF [Actinobacteria bacterium HGW-Actinobacteria-10]
MGLWDNIKSRLGLGDDWEEGYDEYDDAAYAEETPETDDGYVGRPVYESPYGGSSTARRAERDADYDRSRSATRGRDRDSMDREHLRSVPSGAEVSRMAPQVKMHIVEPKSFSEAQSIADRFKQGTPVIMNMSLTAPDIAKRLIDFASGLTYGLDGGLQKVSDKVFMLTPANVDVSAGEVRRLKDKGLFSIDG